MKTNQQQPNDNKQGKSWISSWWPFITAFCLLLLFNGFLQPLLVKSQLKETDYGTFTQYVNEGKVEEVLIKDNKIFFSIDDKEKNGKKVTYVTGQMDDPGLVERLAEAPSSSESGHIVFTQEIPQENSPISNFLMWWVLPGVLFYLIFNLTMKKMSKRGGGIGNFMSFGESGAKIYADSQVKTTFADVAGQDEAKETLQEMVDFLHNPTKYTDIGASLPKGALLVGPPGTGKTLIARAMAGEAHVPFFSISGSEFVQMFVGMGASKVRDLFRQADEKAPCIIFIDEIDAIGKRRDSSGYGGNDEREQTLNQLLTEMDGFDSRKGVVILAATNRPEMLDKALLRPGRFDRRVQMELPDLEGREAILKVHLKHIKHQENISLNMIARAMAGSSGAEIANIVNEAALRAVRMGRTVVNQQDLEESIETVMAGAQRKGKMISDTERRIISYHEIGHAMVAARQGGSAPVHKITIVPRTSGALGYTMQVDSGEQVLMSKSELQNRIATLTGGRAAEELMCGTVTTGASNDIEQATKLARAMVTRYGMSDKYGMMALEAVNGAYLGGDASLACAPETAADIDNEVRQLIADSYAKAKKIITENRAQMDAAAKVLLEKETITGEEFMEIINSPTLLAQSSQNE